MVQAPPSHDLHFDSDLSDLEDDVQVIQPGMSSGTRHIQALTIFVRTTNWTNVESDRR
jgi:hypothetical protein